MPEAGEKKVNVAVLVERAQGDELWSASALLIEGCATDGQTPEEAADNIKPVIEDFVQSDPDLIKVLKNPTEYRLTQVEVDLPNEVKK